ncbi:MAG: hypothetical protein RR523_01695 [Cetobacterium sp.]
MRKKIIITEDTLEKYEEKLVETNSTENVIAVNPFRDALTFGAVIEVEV